MRTMAWCGIAWVGCVVIGCADRSAPPVRASPEPAVVAELAAERPVTDHYRLEPTWYDADAQQVLRLRDGVVEPVQERTLTELPADAAQVEWLRVFDDGSLVVAGEDRLYVYPIGEPLEIDAEGAAGLVVDGRGVDDFWYVGWFAGSSGHRLCHRVAGVSDCSVELTGHGPMIVAGDGSLYATDWDGALLRYHDGALTEVEGVAERIHALRPAGDGAVFAITTTNTNPGVYAVEGSSARRLESRYVQHVLGTPTDYYVVWTDSERAKVDPSCDDGLFVTCERYTLWWQSIIDRVQDGRVTEVAHETCEASRPETCMRGTYGVGRDEGRLVLIGHPLRAIDG